jgi:DNA-binding transcriptional LysR family regulator
MKAVDPADLMFFAHAVEAGGFAPAARRLNVPKSTISKRVSELETRLGAKLIHRSSRSFALTDIGREVYEHARAALIEIQSAQHVVLSRQTEPMGRVQLTASLPTVQLHLAPHFAELARAYPKLQLVVHASDRFVDLAQEGFDIAVRSHFGPLPDSDLVRRVLQTESILLLASRSYLKRRGTPRIPEDLIEHDGLYTNMALKPWKLYAGSRKQFSVAPKVRFVADESTVLLNCAAAGLGIVPLPEQICREALRRSKLVRVLPEWTAGEVTTTILTTHRRGQLPSVRAVVDFLAAKSLHAAAEPQ